MPIYFPHFGKRANISLNKFQGQYKFRFYCLFKKSLPILHGIGIPLALYNCTDQKRSNSNHIVTKAELTRSKPKLYGYSILIHISIGLPHQTLLMYDPEILEFILYIYLYIYNYIYIYLYI